MSPERIEFLIGGKSEAVMQEKPAKKIDSFARNGQVPYALKSGGVRFSVESNLMSNNIEDLQMLRLIKAFQRVRDADTPRKILLYIEEEAARASSRLIKNWVRHPEIEKLYTATRS